MTEKLNDVCIFGEMMFVYLGEMMYKFQWIGLRENLQGFLQIFPQSND